MAPPKLCPSLWSWPYLGGREEGKCFASIIKLRTLRWDHLRLRMAPKSRDRCIYKKRGLRDTERKMPWENESRSDNGVPTSQGTPRVASNHQKLEEKPQPNFPSEPLEQTNPANILIIDFWLLKLWRNKSVLFLSLPVVVICYSSPTKLIYFSNITLLFSFQSTSQYWMSSI